METLATLREARRQPLDAHEYALLEAVAANAAHAAIEGAAPGMTGWALAEYVENELRAAMRAHVTTPV